MNVDKMRRPRPLSAREPDCIHDNPAPGWRDWRHPASFCSACCDGPELREWGEQWDAWLAENPDSPEAQWRARADREAAVRYGKVKP